MFFLVDVLLGHELGRDQDVSGAVLDAGLLTQDEYETKRAEIIRSI